MSWSQRIVSKLFELISEAVELVDVHDSMGIGARVNNAEEALLERMEKDK